MRKRITIRGLDIDAVEMLADLREAERRHLGAIVGDAVRYYHDLIFEDEDENLNIPEAA